MKVPLQEIRMEVPTLSERVGDDSAEACSCWPLLSTACARSPFIQGGGGGTCRPVQLLTGGNGIAPVLRTET